MISDFWHTRARGWEMRKVLLVLAATLTLLATLPTPALAATGKLQIKVKGTGAAFTSGGSRIIYMYLLDSKGDERCKGWGGGKVTVASKGFRPQSKDDGTDAKGLLMLSTTVVSTPGTYKVTAYCTGKGWTFVGYLEVLRERDVAERKRELARSGAPLYPTAALGFVLILVGTLLLAGGRRVGHPSGRSSQVRR